MAIIFDCDGVLVDSEVLGLHDTVTYLKGHGFDWEAPDLIRIFTGYRDDVFRKMLEDAYKERHGTPPGADLFEGLIDTRRRKKDQLTAIAGAGDTLGWCTIRGIPCAVASSSRMVYLKSKLERTNLWSLISPHIYSAELVAHGKPAPDIFLYAAEKINASAADCLVIEDSVQGVKAGIAAGMTVWGFTGGGHCFDGHGERLKEAGATQVMSSFAALRAQYDKLYALSKD